MTDTAASQPSPRLRHLFAPPVWPFVRQAGGLSIAAGVLILIAQIMMWQFDQRMNPEASQSPIFIAAKIILLAGFIVLMFALIAVHGFQAQAAGRVGAAAYALAIIGTMLLGGDLWFESFAVPWWASGPGAVGLTAKPSMIMGLGAIVSYFLFAAGWTLFGVACLRARVFPLAISIAIIIGGIAGYQALLAPWGILLGLAVAMLGIWIVRTTGRHSASTTHRGE